jgi:hypothetical protein
VKQKNVGAKGGEMTKAIKEIGETIKAALPGEKVEQCQRCGNQYILIWLKLGDDYNDFGDRHCPFCGLVTELFHFPARESNDVIIEFSI